MSSTSCVNSTVIAGQPKYIGVMECSLITIRLGQSHFRNMVGLKRVCITRSRYNRSVYSSASPGRVRPSIPEGQTEAVIEVLLLWSRKREDLFRAQRSHPGDRAMVSEGGATSLSRDIPKSTEKAAPKALSRNKRGEFYDASFPCELGMDTN